MARIYGHGPQYALALHGFAQDGTYFEALSRQFPQLSVCAVDLPWHGETDWQAEDFVLRDFDPLIRFLDTQGPIHLVGFSLGARIAVALSQVYPRLTKSMLLLSPDGMAGPYRFLTEYIPQSWKKGLENLLRDPGWLVDSADFLHRNGLLSTFPRLFVRRHLQQPEARGRLFSCWRSLPNFPVTLGANLETPTTIVVGERDELVRLEGIRNFARPLRHSRIVVVDRGHDVLPLPPDLGLFAPE